MVEWKMLYSMLLSVHSYLWYRWSITNFPLIRSVNLNWDVPDNAYHVSIDFLMKFWIELMQVPSRGASLGFCIQRYHWYLHVFHVSLNHVKPNLKNARLNLKYVQLNLKYVQVDLKQVQVNFKNVQFHLKHVNYV